MPKLENSQGSWVIPVPFGYRRRAVFLGRRAFVSPRSRVSIRSGATPWFTRFVVGIQGVVRPVFVY